MKPCAYVREIYGEGGPVLFEAVCDSHEWEVTETPAGALIWSRRVADNLVDKHNDEAAILDSWNRGPGTGAQAGPRGNIE